MLKNSKLNVNGFSLLEVILALAISLIVAGVVLPVWPRIAEQKIYLADKNIVSELSTSSYEDRCKDNDLLAVSDDGLVTTNLTSLPRPGESAGVAPIESSACPNGYCIDGTLKAYIPYISGIVVDPTYGVVDTRKQPIVYISSSANYDVQVDDGNSTYQVSAVFIAMGMNRQFDSTVTSTASGSKYTVTVKVSSKDIYATTSLKGKDNDWSSTYNKLQPAKSAYDVAIASGCAISSSCDSSHDDTQDCMAAILAQCPSALDRLSDSYDAWGNLLYWDDSNKRFYSAGPNESAPDSDDVSQGYIQFDYCENVILF